MGPSKKKKTRIDNKFKTQINNMTNCEKKKK